MKEIIIDWETPEYIPKDRSADWFWAVGIIAAAVIVTSILLNNILLAVFFFIATIAIFIYAKREPDIIRVEISTEGIKAGRNMYPYSILKGFFINEDGPIPHLLLQSSGITNSLLVIPIGKVDLQKIREALQNYLPEEHIEEPLSQKILEYLGF
ncbi:MAG TPA: hypothetical protein VJI33_02610 [Candidatus Paceibacterota bacterium]